MTASHESAHAWIGELNHKELLLLEKTMKIGKFLEGNGEEYINNIKGYRNMPDERFAQGVAVCHGQTTDWYKIKPVSCSLIKKSLKIKS